MATEDTPLRRDAQRNRDKLLAAASRLMAVQGIGVSHDQIAAAAEVGVGTVYRHFPTKDALLEALFREHIEAVAALAAWAGAQEEPLPALELFMTGVLERQAANKGLADVLRGGRNPTLVREATARITPLMTGLLERAQARGDIGPHRSAGDLVVAQFMVAAIMDVSGPRDKDLWRRALSLLLAGLATQTALTGSAPDTDTIDRLYSGPAS